MFNDIKNKLLSFVPKPKNVYDANILLYVCCKILGLVGYTTGRNGERKTYKVTLFSLACCIAQKIVFTVLFYWTWKFRWDKMQNNTLETFVQNFQQLATGFMAIVDMFIAALYAKKIVEFFRKLDEIDLDLERIAIAPNYRLTFIYTSVNAIVVTATPSIILIVYILTHSKTDYIYFFILFMIGLPSVLNVIVELQYAHYAIMVNERFQLGNKHLKTLLKFDDDIHDGWATRIHKISPVSHQLKTRKTLQSIKVVDAVARLHIKLSDAAILLNKVFSVQLLFSIAIFFVAVVSTLFTIVANLSSSSGGMFNLIIIIWVSGSAMQLTGIVYVTCNICDEARKCPRIMHQIRNKSLDNFLNETIEMYSLQMYQNRLQFNVCGLIPLDYTLLYTIVAGVTTYLVILIQMKGTFRPETAGNLTNATGI